MSKIRLHILAFLFSFCTLSLWSQTSEEAISVADTIPLVEYHFQPKSLILPASLITVGAIGTAIDGMRQASGTIYVQLSNRLNTNVIR